MNVVKRDGRKEPVMFDKITARVRKLCYGLNELVDPVKVAMRVIEGLYDGVTTSELDNLAAEIAATMTVSHPDYAKLAARISVSNLHKNTKKTFSEVMTDLYEYVNPRTGKKAPLLSDEVYKIIKDNADELDLPWKDEVNFPAELKKKVFVKRLKGPLFFGYTSDFQELSKEIPIEATHVIIRMSEVPYVDQSGLYAMEEVLLDLSQRDIHPIFEGLQEQIQAKMESIDIIPDLVPRECILPDFRSAMVYIKENVSRDK